MQLTGKKRKEIKAYKRAYYLSHQAEIKAYNLAHKKEITARHKVYNLAHKKEIAASQKAYQLAHAEDIKRKRKTYRLAHNEKIADYQKDYRRKYPEKPRGLCRKYRALKRGNAYEPYTGNYIYERDNWLCGICGRKINKRLKHPNPLSPSIDHIVPVSKGGSDASINVQAAHLRCNMLKSARNGGQLRLIG